MKYLLIFILAIMPSALYGATLGVSYDSTSRNVLQTDLDYTGATANFTASLKVGSVDVVPDSRTVSAGAGMSGGGALSVNRTFTWDPSTFVNNVTLWDGANASRTFTINLSGTDPEWTYTSGVANLSTGTLQYGGNTVGTAANNLSFFAATTSDQFFGVISDEVGSSGTAIRVTGTASNGFVPVSNGAGVITWTAQSGSGSGAPVGTVVNTGTPVQYALPAYSDTTGTNVAPSKLTTDASGTNLYVGALIVTNSATIGSAAGVSITGTNGILTVLGLGDGQDEDFKFDLNGTANAAVITSTTGMTKWDFGTSWVFALGSIELGHASANTITAASGDMTIEGNRIFRVGGADVPVADGGTGLSSGTSGGILGFTASGTIASSAALAANAIVIGGGAGATPTTTTTGTGVLTALGNTANATGGIVTVDGTASPVNKTMAAGSNDFTGWPVEVIFAASDITTAITTGTNKAGRIVLPYSFTLTGVRAICGVAPTGAAITIDLNKASTTVLSTKVTIDAGEFDSNDAAAPVISNSAYTAGEVYTIDFDQVGSSVAGADVKFILIGTRTI